MNEANMNMIEKKAEQNHAQLFLRNNCASANSFSFQRRRWQPAANDSFYLVNILRRRMTDKVNLPVGVELRTVPSSAFTERRRGKTRLAPTPSCASLTRGYSHCTPTGVPQPLLCSLRSYAIYHLIRHQVAENIWGFENEPCHLMPPSPQAEKEFCAVSVPLRALRASVLKNHHHLITPLNHLIITSPNHHNI
jgi:hypothetical protein